MTGTLRMRWTEATHTDGEALAQALAVRLGDCIRAAVEARGHAVLALAGGSTPLPAYRKLADLPLPWDRVALLCTDERWVPFDHPARNERALAAAFAAAQGMPILPLVPAEPGASANAHCANASLAGIAAPFDAVVLGMGADGHSASLFPGAVELDSGLDMNAPDALAVHPCPLPPEAPFARVSLSLPRLLKTRCLLLVIRGSDKREVLARAQRENDPAALPIAAVLHHPGSKVEIHWCP